MLDGTMGVEGDLLDDAVDRPGRFRFDTTLGPWEACKEDFRLSTGITLGGSYGVLWQNYSDPRNGEENSVGYKLTLNFSRTILNAGRPDALTFDLAVEERGPISTDLPPLFGGVGSGNSMPTAAIPDRPSSRFFRTTNIFRMSISGGARWPGAAFRSRGAARWTRRMSI